MNPERVWNRMKTALKERNFKSLRRLVALTFREGERMNRDAERMHPSSSGGGLTVFLVVVSGLGCLIAIFFERVWLWTFVGIVLLYWCLIRMPRRVRQIMDDNRDATLPGSTPRRDERWQRYRNSVRCEKHVGADIIREFCPLGPAVRPAFLDVRQRGERTELG